MAAAPAKSKPLHNFSLSFLKWGGTGTAKTHAAAASNSHRSRRPDQDPDSDSDARPHRVGSRLSRTNRYALSPSPSPSPSPHKHRHQSPLRRNSNDDGADEEEGKRREEEVAAAAEAVAAAEEAVQKPWNLRPRKPTLQVAGGAPRSGNGEAQEHGVAINGEAAAKSLRLRGMTAVALTTTTVEAQSSEKRKFWIALSKDEIEEDIFVMTGSRPNRRPRKRPKNVQKLMDSVFPGLWLVGITADAYKVPDTPAKK